MLSDPRPIQESAVGGKVGAVCFGRGLADRVQKQVIVDAAEFSLAVPFPRKTYPLTPEAVVEALEVGVLDLSFLKRMDFLMWIHKCRALSARDSPSEQ